MAERAGRRHPRARLAAGALLACVAVGGVVALRWRLEPTLTCSTAAGDDVHDGQWLAAPPDQGLALRFSEGSSLSLAAASRVRVVRLGAERVELYLESGSLTAAVRPASGRRWAVAVGPFTVQVLGTRFSTRWQQPWQRLDVAVAEGTVRVAGGIAGAGMLVRTGELLELDLAAQSVRLSPSGADRDRSTGAASPDDLPTPVAVPVSTAGLAGPGVSDRPGPLRSRSLGPASVPAQPAWRADVERGAFSAAWEAVERYGFDDLAEQLDAWDLLRLADLARLTGHPTPARTALVLLRAKYPDQPAAPAAAFRLGRIEFDQGGDPRQAAHWFRLALTEEPDGDLAPDARGRLMEALLRGGDRAGARYVAADYLRLFPDGAHAALARSLAAEPP